MYKKDPAWRGYWARYPKKTSTVAATAMDTATIPAGIRFCVEGDGSMRSISQISLRAVGMAQGLEVEEKER